MSEPTTSAPEQNGQLQRVTETSADGLMMQWQAGASLIFTGLREDNEDDMVHLSRALVPADKELQHIKDEVVEVVNYVAHPATIIDPETGEERQVIRCVFIGADGTTYSGNGPAVQQFTAWLRQAFKVTPWNPPLRIKVHHPVSRVGLAKGQRYVALSLVPRKAAKK